MLHIKGRSKRRVVYDAHPGLPLDPDAVRPGVVKPIHTDPIFIGVVMLGSFFGTLARYGITTLFPSSKDGWPIAIMIINLGGAFLLGLLLQTLQSYGLDEGGRRLLRLGIGTGFLGAFTTYSSLAVGVDLLIKDGSIAKAMEYALGSLIGGIFLSAFGIWIASRYHHHKKVSAT